MKGSCVIGSETTKLGMNNCDAHDWDAGRWGVIIGVSRCKKCGKLATVEDFK